MVHPWLALKSIYQDKGTIKAESLSFKTLWSIVPMIVLLTAVMGTVGYIDLLIKLVPQVWGWLRLSMPMDKVIFLLQRAQEFNFTSLGLLGAGTLLFTFYNLMDAIDDNINDAWRIPKGRPFKNRIAVYFPFLLLLALFLILISQALAWGQHLLDYVLTTSHFPNQWDGQVEYLFFVGFLFSILTIANFSLFWFLPRTKVRFWPVFFASGSTTLVIILFLAIVSIFQSLLFKNYQAFWGSMALLPVFLFLIYGFWVIVLWGAALCRQFHIPSAVHERAKIKYGKSKN